MPSNRDRKSLPPLLKAGERNVLIGLAVFFMAFYALGWWFAGPVATVPALAAAVALLAALVMAGNRRLRTALDEHLQQTQSLLFLQQRLNNELPLPVFDRAALFPDAAATLVGLIRTRKPQLVVELGSGVSTLIVAGCLRDQGSGSIISLEHDPHYSALTRDNLRRHKLEGVARVVDAPLEEVTVGNEIYSWYDVSSLSAVDADVDLLIVDGPPRRVQRQARYPALPLLIDRLAADAVVFVDDANRADEREMVRRWQTAFPGFRTTCIPGGEGTVLLERGEPLSGLD